MLSLFRLLTMGGADAKAFTIRLIGIAVLVIIMVVWGINYRGQNPPVNLSDPRAATPLSPQTARLEVGGSVTGTLAEGERHAWEIEVERGQRLNFHVLGDWDSTLEVIPPSGGDAIAIDFHSGGDYQAFLCAPIFHTNGVYKIVVSGFLGLPDRNFGNYELRVEPYDSNPDCET